MKKPFLLIIMHIFGCANSYESASVISSFGSIEINLLAESGNSINQHLFIDMGGRSCAISEPTMITGKIIPWQSVIEGFIKIQLTEITAFSPPFKRDCPMLGQWVYLSYEKLSDESKRNFLAHHFPGSIRILDLLDNVDYNLIDGYKVAAMLDRNKDTELFPSMANLPPVEASDGLKTIECVGAVGYDKSEGLCWGCVRVAIEEIRGSGFTTGPGFNSPSARAYRGFKVLRGVSRSEYPPSIFPVGTVIKWNSPNIHIEVVTGYNRACSDYCDEPGRVALEKGYVELWIPTHESAVAAH